MPKKHYLTLEIKEDASPAEIKNAYRKLAKKHRPDKTFVCIEQKKDEGGAIKSCGKEVAGLSKEIWFCSKSHEKLFEKVNKKFHEINEAYQILSDPEKKRDYDLSNDSEDGESETTSYSSRYSYSWQERGDGEEDEEIRTRNFRAKVNRALAKDEVYDWQIEIKKDRPDALLFELKFVMSWRQRKTLWNEGLAKKIEDKIFDLIAKKEELAEEEEENEERKVRGRVNFEISMKLFWDDYSSSCYFVKEAVEKGLNPNLWQPYSGWEEKHTRMPFDQVENFSRQMKAGIEASKKGLMQKKQEKEVEEEQRKILGHIDKISKIYKIDSASEYLDASSKEKWVKIEQGEGKPSQWMWWESEIGDGIKKAGEKKSEQELENRIEEIKTKPGRTSTSASSIFSDSTEETSDNRRFRTGSSSSAFPETNSRNGGKITVLILGAVIVLGISYLFYSKEKSPDRFFDN